MNAAITRQSAGGMIRSFKYWAAYALLALAGCGGGGSSGSLAVGDTPAAASCDPHNPATFAACGTLLVGLTDADGDFLSYSVDVLSLTLEKANGTTVETLPTSTRIDFSQYVDLTEFVTAATIPPGSYVAGTIVLDYSDADVMVESGDSAIEATVVDDDGVALTQASFRITLPGREQLLITRGRPSLLSIDFDLAASHTVDTTSEPAIATAEPFIVAEIDPADSKDFRVRGLLAAVELDAMTYSVALRPFNDRVGDFGPVTVHVGAETRFEVNGESFAGSEGLRALNDAGQGTPTVAMGTMNVAEREFTAAVVVAGTSVPGTDADAVKGNVIARNGNDLVVRGATVILRDTRAFFRDDITVSIGPDTRVFKDSRDELLDISAISVGQAATIRGEVTASDELGVHLDASAGTVRMHLTHLSGIVNTVLPGQVDIELHSIDRRRASVYDFTGTGASPAQDADPAHYEVSTGNLPMDIDASGKPVVAYGYPNAFAGAPPDFEGRTIVKHIDVRSALGIGWGSAGTTAPFLSLGSDGIVVDHLNPAIDERHHIKHGHDLIDLTSLDAGTQIVPRTDGRSVFAIKTGGSLHLYTVFAEYVDALALELDGSGAARSMYARGMYDVDTNVFTAYKIFVYILAP